MYGYDFRIFWNAAAQLARGQSPYTVVGYFSPLPLALLLIPFALLPFPVAFTAWTALKLVLLAKTTDVWGFLKTLLFYPVLFELIQGQIDLFVFLLSLRIDWIGVTLSALRPQLAIWIIPFSAYIWLKEKRFDQFWKSASGIAALFSIATIVQPNWWTAWFGSLSIAWEYSQQSASLYGIARVLPAPHAASFVLVLAISILVFWWLRPLELRKYWQWVSLFNPIANVYSLTVLANQVDGYMVMLGLIALPLSQFLHSGVLFSLIPAYCILHDRIVGPTSQ
jgi:hypothetical protein